ncbi:hypothetical protein BV25DRAFT_544287 [Artomyces pyxidatus]|uniref:Uncharacterized protein n=1 Tax=Artomyces pyxidatus TaxID=48021 RepID=A0ACB8TIH6_9AGAM|nr:hypothetical protein BV25DRAFT_544287 [Artomyces pyxidatus]
MYWLALLVLRLVHWAYAFAIAVSSVRSRYFKSSPQPLVAPRRKTPTHLALVLVCDEAKLGAVITKDAFLQCVERATAWCRGAGIGRLTVYDRAGVLSDSSTEIQERLGYRIPYAYDEQTAVDVMYPPTPPLSDDSDSQPPSPRHSLDEDLHVVTMSPTSQEQEKRRKLNRTANRRRSLRAHLQPKTFMLHLISRDSGKPAIASAANYYLRVAAGTYPMKMSDPDEGPFNLSVKELQLVIEGEHGLPPPDLLIVHHVTTPPRQRPPLELYGFPPWQARLTEIYHDGYSGLRRRCLWPILDVFRSPCILPSEVEFRRALDEYANAEFRLGK